MRCKKHYTDLSSVAGVCACCLRERLLSLIAAQEQAEAQLQILDGKHRISERNPAFPNQSAGVAAWSDGNRRKDHHHHHHHPYPSAAPRHRHSVSDQMFDRTPQLGPTSGGNSTGVDSHKKRSFIRLFWFPNIFRSRNRKTDDSISDPGESDSNFREQCVAGNATSSPSMLPNIGHRNRKQPVYADESTVAAVGAGVRRQYCRDRGMSPVRNSDVDCADAEELNNATSEFDQTTESWKNTPRRTPARRGGGGGHVRNLSSLTFCLSPLVRASPNRQWNQKGLAPDGVLSGEIRAPVNAHLSNAKAFHANRSRKLVDHGRLNRNR